MKKVENKTETVTSTVIADVICNMCGESCLDSQGMNYEGLIGAYVEGGFASKLGDMSVYKFDICEICLKQIFDKMIHNPFISHGGF